MPSAHRVVPRHGIPARPDQPRATPSTLVWVLGTPDPAVADDVAATGAAVRVATLDPMAELVLIHRLAVALARARGLDPDHPRHLTRSVVLA